MPPNLLARPGQPGHAVAVATVAAIVLVKRRHDIPLLRCLLEPNGGQTRNMLLGTGGIFLLERVVARSLVKMGLKLPSSLCSMIVAYALLMGTEKAAGKERADKLAAWFLPAVQHLGKWMPLYLAPPLVSVPNAVAEVKGGSAGMWAKLGAVHFTGWIFTLVSTAMVARRLQKKQHIKADVPEEGEEGGGAAAAALTSPSHAESLRDRAKMAVIAEKKAKMRKAWSVITAASFILVPFCGPSPATFSATVLGLLHGNNLPRSVKQILHPLVVCSASAGLVAIGLGRTEGLSSSQALSNFFRKAGMFSGGSGDLFFGLLGSSCAALGFRMFYARSILAENLGPLVGSTLWSSMTSLFGTSLTCGALGIPATLGVTLAQRSVMSSLGLPAANLLGGSSALAVASILLTGVYGASAGTTLLTAIGVDPSQVVARGIATGASSHSIGTSALMEDEGDAAAIASVGLCLAGIFHTAICSVPIVQRTLRQIAGASRMTA